MKKTFSTIIILTLAIAMLFALTGCGKDKEDEKTGGENFDWSAHPSSFDDWTISDVHAYMEECGVFKDDYYYLDLSANDLAAMNLAGGFLYMDTDTANAIDYVMAFDLTNAESKAVYDASVAAMNISDAVVVDAFVGQFAFSYSEGINEDHVALMGKVIDDLSAHFNLTPVTAAK